MFLMFFEILIIVINVCWIVNFQRMLLKFRRGFPYRCLTILFCLRYISSVTLLRLHSYDLHNAIVIINETVMLCCLNMSLHCKCVSYVNVVVCQ